MGKTRSATKILKSRMDKQATFYRTSQPYRLGLIYRQIGDTLMDPDSTVTDLARLADRFGFDIVMELEPREKTKLTEG